MAEAHVESVDWDTFVADSEISTSFWRDHQSGIRAEGQVFVSDSGFHALGQLCTGRGPVDGLRERAFREEQGYPINATWHPDTEIDVDQNRQVTEVRTSRQGIITMISGAGDNTFSINPRAQSVNISLTGPLADKPRVTTSLNIRVTPTDAQVRVGTTVDRRRIPLVRTLEKHNWIWGPDPLGEIVLKLDGEGQLQGVSLPYNHPGWPKRLGVEDVIPDLKGFHTYTRNNWIPDDQRDLQAALADRMAEVLGIEGGSSLDLVSSVKRAYEILGQSDADHLSALIFNN